jgi:hypothetical protein
MGEYSKDKLANLRGSQDNSVAWAIYKKTLNETGWALLSIYTNSKYSDDDQFSYAGYLEGYLTYDLIYAHFDNYAKAVLQARTLPTKAQEFVTKQREWMLEKSSKTLKNDENKDYWDLVKGMLLQNRGMYNGYVARHNIEKLSPETLLQYEQFYYISSMGDLFDIIPAFNATFDPPQKPTGDCTIFVKLLENNTKLSVVHNTHNIFVFMLRILKNYNFALNNPSVTAKRITFTSRPGDLNSKDDFYTTDSGLNVMETSFDTYNASNYKFLHHDSVPCWIRVNVATRMAKSGSQWHKIFQIDRSGTHVSQWMIIDFNKFNEKSRTDIAWMGEEYYSMYSTQDFTEKLWTNGYIAEYNVPFNKSIYEISNYTEGYKYTWDDEPRAIILKQLAPTVQTLEDSKKVIRWNKNDTGEICGGIAPRCDLSKAKFKCFGATDGKGFDNEMFWKGEVWVVSGPTTDDNPPFSFTGEFEQLPHMLHPITFNFPWIKVNLNDMSFVTQNQWENKVEKITQ